MDHSGMDHGEHHGGMDMGACSMNMLWNSDIKNVCVVFESCRITGWPSMLLAMLVLFLLSIGYERLRQMVSQQETSLKRKHLSDVDPRSGKRRLAANAPQPESTIYLLPDGCRIRLPLNEQLVRSAMYTAVVALSFFIMLVIMTYNTYLIASILAGAFAGHVLFQRDLHLSLTPTEVSEDRGMACH